MSASISRIMALSSLQSSKVCGDLTKLERAKPKPQNHLGIHTAVCDDLANC